MTHTKKYILYAAVFLFSTGLFTFLLFPGEKVEKLIIAEFSRQAPEATLTINGVVPALPAGLRLDAPTVAFDTAYFEAETLYMGYDISSLWQNTHGYRFKMQAYKGRVYGKVAAAKANPGKIDATAHMESLQIAEIEPLNRYSNDPLAGLLAGEVSYSATAAAKQGTFTLMLSDCKIPLTVAFFDIGALEFYTIETDGTFSDRQIKIAGCKLKGKQVDGEISGTITVSPVLVQSRLNLSGKLKPHPDFIKKLPRNILPGSLIRQNGISFRILGTLEKPNFTL